MKSTAIRCVLEAGNLLMKNFSRVKSVEIKKKTSLVTNVDFESDRLIKKIIHSKFPSHNIVSEESDIIDNGSDYTWHIDPVDGTHNYARCLPFFGVSVALEFRKKVILGAINLPYLKRVHFAEKGKGAFCNGKRIRVSDRKNLDFSFIILDFNSRSRQKSAGIVKKLSSTLVDIRNFGCAVYGLTEVANGNIDAYIIQKTNSWDLAASFLLIEEAGGRVANHKNNEWSIDEPTFRASNGSTHESLIKILK